MNQFLTLIFFLSGASALVFQVVWQRLLTVHYGVGAISTTLIVSVYMLGLGAGALIGGQLVERSAHRLRLYLGIELLIGLFGIASLPFLDGLGRATAGADLPVALASMALFLLVPTMLMGATLPVLLKVVNRFTRDLYRSVSTLYFANTLGAALGALLAAYGLISFLGLDGAVYVASGGSLLLACAIGLLDRFHPGAVAVDAPAPPPASDARAACLSGRPLLALALVTGFTAIGYEIVWFRIIGVLIKASPYAFATTLSVYLLGIALGSYGMERFLRNREQVRKADLLFTLQFLLGTCVTLTVLVYVLLFDAGPFERLARSYFVQELHPDRLQPAAILRVLFWPFFFEFVPTLLIGASFPLVASLASPGTRREGATVGRVYFVVTLGNLLGAIVTGFVLLERAGTEITLGAFAALNVALFAFVRRWRGRALAPMRRLAVVGVVLLVGLALFPGRGELHVRLHPDRGERFERFFAEGRDAVVMTHQQGSRVINTINGLGHGGRPSPQFAAEAVHALSQAREVSDVLVIGFGTGTTVEMVLTTPGTEAVTLVELNKTLLRNLRKIDALEAILEDSRLRIVLDDGRRFLLRSEDSWDVILMDPLRSTTSHSNNLYSLEFFRLVAARLRPGGTLLVWTDDPRFIPRTLAFAFRHVRLYWLQGGGFFCLASHEPTREDGERRGAILQGLHPPEARAVRQTLEDLKLLRDRDGILRATSGLPVNRDWHPVSEYYLGVRALPMERVRR